MAIVTANRRAAVISYALPGRPPFNVPDGTISSVDMSRIIGLYYIEAVIPTIAFVINLSIAAITAALCVAAFDSCLSVAADVVNMNVSDVETDLSVGTINVELNE